MPTSTENLTAVASTALFGFRGAAQPKGTMKVNVCTTLHCSPTTTVEIPVKSWDEIKEWFVKWDTLHYTIDGEKWEEIELNNGSPDDVDWKRPIHTIVSDPETGDILQDD